MKKLIERFKNWKLFTAVFAFLLLASCEKEEVSYSDNTLETVSQLSKMSDERKSKSMEFFAKLLAKSLKAESLRVAIRDEALNQFDGDYDILYQQFTDKNIDGNSFNSVMVTNSGSIGKTTEKLKRISDRIPLLQIAVPVNIEKWNTETFTPLVAVVDNFFDSKTTKFVKAYDGEGNIHMLDVENEPDFPVVVVSLNERVRAVDKNDSDFVENLNPNCPIMQSAPSPFYSSDNYNFYLKNELSKFATNCGGGGGSSGGGSSGSNCITYDNYFKLNKMIFQSMETFRQAESWLTGNPEIKVIALFGQPTGAITHETTFIASGDRSKWKDCSWFTCDPEWFEANQNLARWFEEYGERVQLAWWEADDSGATTTISVSGTYKNEQESSVTVTGSYTVKAKDYELGTSIMDYCDGFSGEGAFYDTGKISYYINQ